MDLELIDTAANSVYNDYDEYELLLSLAEDWLANETPIKEIQQELHAVKIECTAFQYWTEFETFSEKKSKMSNTFYMDLLLEDIRFHRAELLIRAIKIEPFAGLLLRGGFRQKFLEKIFAPSVAYCNKCVQFMLGASKRDKKYCHSLAKLGLPTFQFEYAMYLLGQIKTERDLEDAYLWMEKSANQGHAKALFILGLLTKNGIGVKQSKEKGIALFKESFENNLIYVRFKLDYMADQFDKFGSDLAKGNTDLAEQFENIQKGKQNLTDPDTKDLITTSSVMYGDDFKKVKKISPTIPLQQWLLETRDSSTTIKACDWLYSSDNNSSHVSKRVKDVFIPLLTKKDSKHLGDIYFDLSEYYLKHSNLRGYTMFTAYELQTIAHCPAINWDSLIKSLVFLAILNQKNQFVDDFLINRYSGKHGDKIRGLIIEISLNLKNKELKKVNKKLLQKDQELEEMMAMFAHKFRSPLDAILYNTSHSNNAEIYERHAQTMRGLLDIFSMISTDQHVLVSKLTKDTAGDGTLKRLLVKIIDMIMLHLLTESGSDKIHQHFLAYAKKSGDVPLETSATDWYNDHFELEDKIRASWQQEYAELIDHSGSLDSRLKWIEQYFFKLDITGFDNSIRFKEYGVTDSFLVIVINEILTNLFKYYSSDTREGAALHWQSKDGYQIIKCSNPSVKSERLEDKGSYKGHKFLSTVAMKTGSIFEKPEIRDNFSLEFLIPDTVLLPGSK